MRARGLCHPVAAFVLAFVSVAPAFPQDQEILPLTPEPVLTERAAARFLEQASFGADPPGVAALRGTGLDAWLDGQFLAEPSSLPDAPADVTTLAPLQQTFFYSAMNGADQLRQRVAFALSQIWVVSGVRIGRPEAFLPYLRILQKDAFGNYYDLMRDITLNPAMGRYLDMVNNDNPPPNSGRGANENYAREFLQLFTIGMEKLEIDGTPIRDANNQPIPTYSQETIEELARVFTGWTYAPAPGQVSRLHNPVRWDAPMVPVASNHDSGEKVLLDGFTLPAGQTPDVDLSQALENVFRHPNVGPFIGKQLIQHLVTSNPSPAYVGRVSAAFADNGYGVRGDMKAVIRAILLDPEARQFDDAPLPEVHAYGHLREPVLFITALLRALSASVPQTNNLAAFARNLGQNVYYSPTVFNYFAPSYQISETELLGPEFQLLSPASAMARANFLNRLFFGTLGDGTVIDFTPFRTAASDPASLLDLVDAGLVRGSMTAATRDAILRAVTATTDNLTRARTALYLAAASGEYQVEQ